MKHKELWFLVCAGIFTSAAAREVVDVPSLEDLVKADITSVSRKSQSLSDVPAAAFVISSEDIRRSGALSLPDVLRMAPGVEVSQIDNGRYAISARGFNGRFSNKLQVLVDGRSIYQPLFSGVVWENDFIALEDIERIEVIRGPGAAMWGANAVNGVINIISRPARKQVGTEATLTVGERSLLSNIRYGKQEDEQTSWRLSAQHRQAEPSNLLNFPGRSNDRLNNDLLDFRLDKDWGGGQDFSFWANASESGANDRWLENPQFSPSFHMAAIDIKQRYATQFLMGRYRWLSESGVESSFQGAVSSSTLNEVGAIKEERMTYDLDYQARYVKGTHDLVWGASYRYTSDNVTAPTVFLGISPSSSLQRVAGIFFQDDWTLVPEVLRLGAGGRWDHNTLGGTTFAPNASVIWTPTRTDTLWAKLAKAARSPARAEQDINIFVGGRAPNAQTFGLPVMLRTVGALTSLKPEWLTGTEVGYRKQLASNVSVDLTAFHYRYKDLRSGYMIGTPTVAMLAPGEMFLLQESATSNGLSSTSTGAELAVDWIVAPNWRLQLSYSAISQRFDANSNPVAQSDGKLSETTSPRHYGSLRSQWNLSPNQQFDAWLRGSAGFNRVDLPYLEQMVRVPGYVTLDLRYAHRLNKQLELSITGRNLIGARRTEYVSDYIASIPVTVEPSVFVSARMTF